MDDYNFLKDLLTTFRLSPDWIKALWLTVPPALLLGVFALLLNYRLKLKQLDEPEPPDPGRLYPVVRDDGRWKVLEESAPEKLVLSGRVKPRRRH